MATNDEAVVVELEALLTQLHADWPVRAWGWDGRLPTATSSVTGEQIAQAQALVLRAMPQQFEAATLASAPADVLAFVQRSGGLRGNQLAFCVVRPGRTVVGLWWPWGGGGTVSLRVGFVGAESDPQLAVRLRTLFGVAA
jgi:hypothetical protein